MQVFTVVDVESPEDPYDNEPLVKAFATYREAYDWTVDRLGELAKRAIRNEETEPDEIFENWKPRRLTLTYGADQVMHIYVIQEHQI